MFRNDVPTGTKYHYLALGFLYLHFDSLFNLLELVLLLFTNYSFSAARKTCKNVIRFNNVAFQKIQACCFYEVDALLPITMIRSALSYAVVVIQFALVKK